MIFVTTASVLLAVGVSPLMARPVPELAQPNGITPVPEHGPVPANPSQPEQAPSVLAQQGPSPRLSDPIKPAVRRTDPGPLTLASPQMRKRLLLVYELSVTPAGAQDDVFAKLLARHKLPFNQTVRVVPKDQQILLKQRYLQGVGGGGRDRKDRDEINLFLVFCKASQADAMYTDLTAHPAGFAAFRVNLTTCDADILRRARAARAAVAQSGTAHSSSGIAPDQPVTSPGADAPPGTHTAPVFADFDCELLFVVRNLKPPPRAGGAGTAAQDLQGSTARCARRHGFVPRSTRVRTLRGGTAPRCRATGTASAG
jgi:hypothetical protein